MPGPAVLGPGVGPAESPKRLVATTRVPVVNMPLSVGESMSTVA